MNVKNIPTFKSSETEWMNWHQGLIDTFGKQDADVLLIKGLAKRWKQGAKSTTFIDYLQKQNIPVDLSLWEQIKDTTTDAGAELLITAQKVKNIGDSVLDTIGSFVGVGKYVVIGLAVVAVGGVAMIVYNIGKNPIAAAGAAAKFTPAGAAAGAVGR